MKIRLKMAGALSQKDAVCDNILDLLSNELFWSKFADLN